MNDTNNIVTVISSEAEIKTVISENLEIVAHIIGEGPPGYTPRKGIDYFTEEDIAEIVQRIEQDDVRDKNYIHSQIVSSNEWTINHDLGKFPSVTVVDSSGALIFGEVEYLSNVTVVLRFSSEFSGVAYLN